MEENKDLIPFEGKPIRKVWHNEEWYFSVVDVISILTDSPQPNAYWGKMKKREVELLPICNGLKFLANDGKMRPTDCANTKDILRIVMSIPSPKAQKLKLWLAYAGKEKLEKANDFNDISDLIASTKMLNSDIINEQIKTYLMCDILRGFYKIGKSKSPLIRERTLQAEIPTIELVHVIENDMEKMLHEKFSKKRLRGEWFNLSKNDINYIKQQ